MARLDSLVLSALAERLLNPERLTEVLLALLQRRAAKAQSIETRLVNLQSEVARAEEGLRRLYRMVETGLAELDDLLAERIKALKGERERAQAALDRARSEGRAEISIAPEKVVAFSALMRDMLQNAAIPARKMYIRALLSAVEVDDNAIRILGSREVLAAAVAGNNSGDVVQFSGPKWRTRRDSNPWPLPSEGSALSS
jgi:site-specific DNA recombinase